MKLKKEKLSGHSTSSLWSEAGSLRVRVTGSRRVDGQVRVRGVGWCSPLGGGLAVAVKSDRKVFDVSGPLSGELEELHVVPLHAVYCHCRETETLS